MKKVSIQTLKAHLSALIEEAETWMPIVITRHRDAVAQLGPVRTSAVRRGRLVGSGRLQPALKHASRGRYLPVLLDDRGQR